MTTEHGPALVEKAAEARLADLIHRGLWGCNAVHPMGNPTIHTTNRDVYTAQREFCHRVARYVLNSDVLATVAPAIREAVLLEAASTFRKHERDGYLFIDENHERVPWEAVAQQLERMAREQRRTRTGQASSSCETR
jgi:hypothetical protein